MKKASVDVTVAFRDLDGMRTAYHPVYIEWFDLARTKLLTECGIKFERWEKGGIVFPVVALHCEYKEGAAFGDKLRVTAMVREVRGKVLNVDYEIYIDKSTMSPEFQERIYFYFMKLFIRINKIF